jgi:FKBP-type peptidyl-prolyl cis-trans isomerase SlyD
MIGQDSVVSMRHTLKSDGGEVVDSSNGNEPMVYLHGANNLIPGLEAELNGKTSGANFCASIPPDKAYGELSDELIQVTSKSMFQGAESIEPGISFVAQGDGSARCELHE